MADRTPGFIVGLMLSTSASSVGRQERFATSGLHTRPAILLLVAPDARRVEVVTSPEIRQRVCDRACADAIAAMTGYFARSDTTGGIVAGIRRLQTAAGPAIRQPSAATFPDLIEEDEKEET